MDSQDREHTHPEDSETFQSARRGHGRRFPLSAIKAALLAHKGLVSRAAASLGCHVRTINQAIKRHPQLARIREQALSAMLDDAEESLAELVKERNVPATIFCLKTQGRARGYSERTDALPPVALVKVVEIRGPSMPALSAPPCVQDTPQQAPPSPPTPDPA